MPATGTAITVKIELTVADYPDLRLDTFISSFPAPLAEVPTPPEVLDLLRRDAPTPFERDETLRADIRTLLRHSGYKPTGRGKPASEYLAARAAAEGGLPSINAAVDACNAASLHGGFPISVIDLDRATPPFRIAPAEAGARYVFNPAGQEIDVGGLLCLHDAEGPCANAVKDAQRTRTSPETTRTLSVVWGTSRHAARFDAVADLYRGLVRAVGARLELL